MSVSVNTTTGNCWVLSPASIVCEMTLLLISLFFGVFANAFVIVLVWRSRVPHRDMNILISNMALSDLILLMVLIPGQLDVLFSGGLCHLNQAQGTFGVILEKVYILVCNSMPFISGATLLVISLERFRAVSTTIQRLPVSRLQMALVVSTTWLIPALLNSYQLFRVGTTQAFPCGFEVFVSKGFEFAIVRQTFVFLVCIAVFALCVGVIYKLRHTQTGVNLPQTQQKSRDRYFRSAVKMMITSVSLPLLCGTFSFVSVAAKETHMEDCGYLSILSTLCFLQVFSSALSPIIYFVFLSDFRLALRAAFYRNAVVGITEIM